jgi:hypothetical protein
MEEKEKGFNPTFMSMPMKHAITLRSALMVRNGWSPAQWNHKRLGRRRPNQNEIASIEAEFGKYGLNPWTGKKIKPNGNT